MKEQTETGWIPDECQQRVIDASGGGYHLVLAPPGCGKTQILTERIRRAHAAGIPYRDMLCLTFTNRAARGMRERIDRYIGDAGTADLYVGNIHRFCSRFLYDNGIVAAGSSVIDDDDAVSILARYLNEEEDEVKSNYNRRRGYAEIIQFAHLMHQIAHRHPRGLRLHPDSISADDVYALRYICKVQHREFTPDFLLDVYDHTDYYNDAIAADDYDVGARQLIGRLLYKMRYAHAYTAYCRKNKLLDFEDLLLLTYDELAAADDFRRYRWIQVDEVQDLNAMQVAIVDRLTHPDVAAGDGMVMYLGDAQQAIFSFMGAKGDTLSLLRSRCEGRIHHLGINHRSPGILLRMLNDYASGVLHVDPRLLPEPCAGAADGSEDDLRILTSDTVDAEYADVARFVTGLYRLHPKETTAVIVTANYDADKISEQLQQLQTPFFKVSGTDIFSSSAVKLMLAHLNVLACETDFMAWARLLYGLGVMATPASSREFVRRLLNRAILPSDFLCYNGTMTYVQAFASTLDTGEVVVFDTETTGLSVFDDDILQIAAVRLRGGRVVPGSVFTVHMETDRPIPEMLGDTPNPILAERERQPLLGRAEGLRRFMQYAGDSVLVGHNVDYDYHILENNLRRYLPDGVPDGPRVRFDTLKLLRLFYPDLAGYRLDDFRRRHQFGLREDNAHLADVDVDDTCRIVAHLYDKCREYRPLQLEFLAQDGVARRADRLRRNYRDIYLSAVRRLYRREADGGGPAFTDEMRTVCRRALDCGLSVPATDKLELVFRYIGSDVVDACKTPALIEQLRDYLVHVNTLKEADLCGSPVIGERVFVSTVHKAKGLEFDNVVVFDVVDGRYPGYYNRGNDEAEAEDKRKLYVALSRAKRRLYLSWNMNRTDYHGQPHPRELSPFLQPILRYFGS